MSDQQGSEQVQGRSGRARYPCWLRAIGYGLGGALVTAAFSDGIFAVGLGRVSLGERGCWGMVGACHASRS